MVDVEELRSALIRKFRVEVGDELVTSAIAALDLRRDSVVAEEEWKESLEGLLGERPFSEFEQRTRELGPPAQKYFCMDPYDKQLPEEDDDADAD